MSEQVTQEVTQVIPEVPAQPATPTPVQAATTPTTAVNVDIDSLVNAAAQKAAEVAEKRAEGAFKSMLQQQGLDAATITKMTEEWKAKQVTPEDTIKSLQAELKDRDSKLKEKDKAIEAERQEKIALSKGVPLATQDEAEKEKVTALLTLARSYMNAETPFDIALDKALQIVPMKKEEPEHVQEPQNVPKFDSGTPDIAIKTELEELKTKFAKARKLNNTAEMVRLTRIAGEKKLNIF